jgi:hypothetical protein
VDIFFTCNDILAALPRTTQINDSTTHQAEKTKKGSSHWNRPHKDRKIRI